jgi:hypothetical protein
MTHVTRPEVTWDVTSEVTSRTAAGHGSGDE